MAGFHEFSYGERVRVVLRNSLFSPEVVRKLQIRGKADKRKNLRTVLSERPFVYGMYYDCATPFSWKN